MSLRLYLIFCLSILAENLNKMYSIADLQQLSGIKAHTIRVWEQRYNALSPIRSKGNTRYYTEQELKRLLKITTLVNAGYKISEVCSWNLKTINQHIQNQEIAPQTKTYELFIQKMIIAGLDYDEFALENLYLEASSSFNIKKLYQEILMPLLTRIGVLWNSDATNIQQEHFISNFVRKKLYVAIDGLANVSKPSKKWLLFLPSGEFHDLSLLFAQYLIKSYMQSVYYLGQNVPAKTVIEIVKEVDITNLLLFSICPNPKMEQNNYIKTLQILSNSHNIYIGGKKSTEYSSIVGIKTIATIEDLEHIIAEK